MSTSYDLTNKQTNLHIQNLDQPQDIVDHYEALLSAQELEKAYRFVFPEHQRRYIVARGRLREILAEYTGESPTDITFEYGEHGKPTLANNQETLYFNVSHSEEMAIYAINKTCELGVDIEHIKREVDLISVAERYFTENESQKILFQQGFDQTISFFNCWTRKEAILKALGQGLSFPLKDCEITVLPNEPAQVIQVEGHSDAAKQWSIHSFTPAENFIVAVVVMGACEEFTVIE